MRTLLLAASLLLSASLAFADEPAKIVLEVSAGADAGKKLVVHAGDAFQVGRAAENDLQLGHDPKLSRKHLKVSCDTRHCQVEDLGSTNGTLLNGKSIKNGELKVGDKLKLGETELVVRAP